MDQYFIGVDSGTQGTKAVIVSVKQKKVLAASYRAYPMIEGPNGKKEQEPHLWIEAVIATIREAVHTSGADPAQVLGIGVSGQQHGCVPLDRDGNVIRPAKLWCDTETDAEAREITEALGGESAVIAGIGNSIAVGFTASKIAWLKKHEPENYDKMQAVLLPHDYINFWLTGEMRAECGDASGTAYFDVHSRSYSPDVLRAIDDSGKLAECVPKIIGSDQPVGRLRANAAEKLGLSREVVVSSGGGDNMMAAIGAGNVKPGVVTMSLGTSGTIYSFSETPIVDEQGELASFCSSDGHWLPLVCTMNVTVATELTRALFEDDVSVLNDKIAASPVGADGVLMLPYFNGERTPALPNATASLHGLNASNYNSQNISRAAMEGATFGLRYGLDVLKRNGIEPKEIRLVGGGSKSAIWRQIVADVFNAPVVCPVTQEAGAFGAALQAFWCFERASGKNTKLPEITEQFVSLNKESRCEPNAQHVAAYDEIYEKYQAVNSALAETYN